MKKMLFFFFSLFFLLFINNLTLAQDKVSVYVLEGKKKLLVKIDSVKALPLEFSSKLGKQSASYKLYEVRDTERVVEELKNKLNTPNKNPEEILKDLSEKLNEYDKNLIELSKAPECQLDCARVTLNLLDEISYNKTYALKITGVSLNANKEPETKKIIFELPPNPSADILPSLNAFNRQEIRVESKTPLKLETDVKIIRRTYNISKDLKNIEENLHEIADSEIADAKDKDKVSNLVTFRLGSKLSAGQSYDLLIEEGLSDGLNQVHAKGVISFPGLPTQSQSPKIDLAFSSFAAVDQKPTFNLSGRLVPVRPQSFGTWFWEPSLALDIGFGTTRSSNSITINSPFTKTFLISRAARPPAGSKIPIYAAWANTPWHRLSNIKFYIGPKLEADRKFDRINLVGTTRLDFNFHKFIGLIKKKRDLLERNLASKASFVEIDSGLNIIPYVAFDFGRHTTNEIIRNDKRKASVLIPSHPIFRTYVGLNTVIERKLFSQPFTLCFDGYLLHLGQKETIGFVVDSGVALRRLEGFHPYGKASLNIPLDPTKHYNLVFTFENGRSSPNFEYLNKTSAGIKVIY
jgi:hypothetical protein